MGKGPSPERAATTRLRRFQTFRPSTRNGEVRPSRDISGRAKDHPVAQDGVIRARVADVPTVGSRQLAKQVPCFLEVASVEALGEPAVGGCE